MTEFQGQAETLIKKLEGFQEKAYWDVDQWAVGYGFRKGVTKGQRMTKEEADVRLSKEVKPYSQAVESLVTNSNVTDDQKAALTSFAYNVGIGALKESTLLKKVNAGDVQGAASEFGKWSNINKTQFSSSLYKRRMQEKALFLGKDKTEESSSRTYSTSTINPNLDLSSSNQSLLARYNALAASFGRSSNVDLDRWTDRLRQEGRGA